MSYGKVIDPFVALEIDEVAQYEADTARMRSEATAMQSEAKSHSQSSARAKLAIEASRSVLAAARTALQ